MSAQHLIPGCDGYGHADGLCEVSLDRLGVVVGELEVTVNAVPGQAVELAVWNDSGDLLRTNDRAAGHAFAERIRAFADSVDKGASLLGAPVVKPEQVDYAARFAALDSDVLFDMEEADDTTAAHAYVESLLIVLADWRPRILSLLESGPAWSIPEVAAYGRALDRTREAYLQWSFRWEGGPALPDSFALPVAADRLSAANTPLHVARITSAGRRDLVVRGAAA